MIRDTTVEHQRLDALRARVAAKSRTNGTAHAAVNPLARHLVLTSASSVPTRAVHWLWSDRIAVGTLALVAGREGLGKSSAVMWLVAQLTRGTLPGERHGQPAQVMICATEDSRAHTLVPRLMAAGADLTRVHFVEVQQGEIHLGLDLPRDLVALEQSARDNDVALLVLDPLMSRLGSDLDTHKDGDVRRALEPLVAIADRVGMSIVGLIHHNKSSTSDPLSAVMASKAFTAVARSVHTVAPDPDDDTEQRRLLGTIKNNLGRGDLPTLSFTIEGYRFDTDDGETGWTSRVVWGDEVPGSIRDALERGREDQSDRSQVTEAAEWMTDFLIVGGATAKSADVKKAGHAAGYSERTIQRARERLRLEVRSQGFPRCTWWSLPGTQVPVEDQPSSDTVAPVSA